MLILPWAVAEGAPSVEVRVYSDGVAHVREVQAVDPTAPSLTLDLLSESLGNILVTDEGRSPLPYEIVHGQMIVHTLGASAVTLEYDTSSLTKKEGNVWTIHISAQGNLTIVLPRESSVLYISDVPLASTVKDGSPVLTLGASKWEISYMTPLPAPEASARGPPYEYLLAGAVAVGTALFVLRRRRGRAEEPDQELRPEDRQILDFLAERGGRVLEVELRERFALPKTTTWRAVKRLERLGKIRVRKVGGVNEIELADKA